MIRPMGRFWMEASPFNTLSKGWPERMPEIRRVVVPLFPVSNMEEGARKPVKSFSMNQDAVFFFFNGNAHLAEACDGGKAVRPF